MKRISEEDTIFRYELSDKEIITIEVDDSGSEVKVINGDGKEIGSVSFDEQDDGFHQYCKITWMYLDKLGDRYIRKGIGREVLKCQHEYMGLPLVASQNDGHKQDDGSHLTGDAPAFIAKMRQEGIVVDDEDRGHLWDEHEN